MYTQITTSAAILKEHNQGNCDVPEIKPVFLAVADEGAELARVDVIVQRQQVALVELEGAGELLQQLPHAVDELAEHGRHLLGVDRAQQAAAVGELVAERQPLFLDQVL